MEGKCLFLIILGWHTRWLQDAGSHLVVPKNYGLTRKLGFSFQQVCVRVNFDLIFVQVCLIKIQTSFTCYIFIRKHFHSPELLLGGTVSTKCQFVLCKRYHVSSSHIVTRILLVYKEATLVPKNLSTKYHYQALTSDKSQSRAIPLLLLVSNQK